MHGKLVNDWPTRISQSQQLRNFIECLSRRVVSRMSDVVVKPSLGFLFGEIKMCVAARNYEREHREVDVVIALLTLLEQHGVNMSLEMIDRNQRLVESEPQRLGITDSDQ